MQTKVYRRESNKITGIEIYSSISKNVTKQQKWLNSQVTERKTEVGVGEKTTEPTHFVDQDIPSQNNKGDLSPNTLLFIGQEKSESLCH